MGVVQICERDLQLLHRNHIVAKPQPVAAAGFQNHATRLVGGKISIEAGVVSAGASADYDQIVTLSTGAVQVHETDDDNISKTILRGVSAACKQTIAHHVSLRRWVFVAAKAIQADDYEAVFERVASASASGNCFFCWGRAKGEITGRLTDKNRATAEKTFVTIALVPAEVENRQFISLADLQTNVPVTRTRRLARAAHVAQATIPRGLSAGLVWEAPPWERATSIQRPSQAKRVRSNILARAELR